MKIRKDSKDPYFNYALREARQSGGFKVKDIASAAGVSPMAIYSYERLRSMPCDEIAGRIAGFFGRTVEQLFPEKLRTYVEDIQKERYGDFFDPLKDAVSLDMVTETLIDGKGISPVDAAMGKELAEMVKNVVDSLGFRSKTVISMHFGMPSGYTHTYEDIGKQLKLTRERIRQIEARAVQKLQNPRRAHLLESF